MVISHIKKYMDRRTCVEALVGDLYHIPMEQVTGSFLYMHTLHRMPYINILD